MVVLLPARNQLDLSLDSSLDGFLAFVIRSALLYFVFSTDQVGRLHMCAEEVVTTIIIHRPSPESSRLYSGLCSDFHITVVVSKKFLLHD